MRRNKIFLILSVFFVSFIYKADYSYADYSKFKTFRIAHAGGGINGKTYTNSYNALNINIDNGYKYFELDFSFTIDTKLVCLHDWKKDFIRWFGFSITEKPTLETYSNWVKNKLEFKKCTLDGLALWLKNNPDVKIVTDVKEDNLRALSIIRHEIPNSHKQIIPQIYQPQNFKTVKEMGYEQIIWTLYRFIGSNRDVMKCIDRLKSLPIDAIQIIRL